MGVLEDLHVAECSFHACESCLPFSCQNLLRAAEKRALLTQLVQDFQQQQQQLVEEQEQEGAEGLLEGLLTALRLCLRERVALEPAEHSGFLAALMACACPALCPAPPACPCSTALAA